MTMMSIIWPLCSSLWAKRNLFPKITALWSYV